MNIRPLKIIMHLILILMSLSCILPLILMISISFSSEKDVVQYGFSLIPRNTSLDAYKLVFMNSHQIISSYITTISFSAIQTVLSMIVQGMVAYSLSRKNFKARGAITTLLFITMLFSGGLVPTYLLITKYLHLYDSFWVYIIPNLVNAWNIIIYRTFFQGLPNEMIEAAKTEGASELRIFFSIIIPLSTPVFASLGFMNLVAKWNDWNTTLLYIKTPELYSLQYLLQRILREAEFMKNAAMQQGASSFIDLSNLPTETVKYATAIVAAGPMLLIFPFFQKYFSKGLTVGAVKG